MPSDTPHVLDESIVIHICRRFVEDEKEAGEMQLHSMLIEVDKCRRLHLGSGNEVSAACRRSGV